MLISTAILRSYEPSELCKQHGPHYTNNKKHDRATVPTYLIADEYVPRLYKPPEPRKLHGAHYMNNEKHDRAILPTYLIADECVLRSYELHELRKQHDPHRTNNEKHDRATLPIYLIADECVLRLYKPHELRKQHDPRRTNNAKHDLTANECVTNNKTRSEKHTQSSRVTGEKPRTTSKNQRVTCSHRWGIGGRIKQKGNGTTPTINNYNDNNKHNNA